MIQYIKLSLGGLIMKNYILKLSVFFGVILLVVILAYKFNLRTSSNVTATKPQAKRITPLAYTGQDLLNKFNKTTIDNYPTAAGTFDLATMASQITSQLTQAFSSSTEKTLPLVANWNVGIPEDSNGLDPMYMINRLSNGEHIVPTWKLDAYFNDTIGLSYYEESIKKAAELGLPLVFILPSPESALIHDDVYFSMDRTNNPNVITTNGTVIPKLSPFGPNNLWNEVGGQWSTTSLIAQLQEWYPNPPLVLFIDTDSSKKLSWSELSSSSRYTSQYPADATDEFKRTLVNAKWMEKYRQLHQGFKNGFVSNIWKKNAKFISRNQLALNMGTTSDWQKSATTTNLYANIWPLTADGLTIDFNLDGDKTDTTNAPHTLLNNLPFMLDQAKVLDSNFTYQLSINANKKIDNPQRYRGFTQFALWFLRPSIIRQTPNKSTKDEINPLFQQVVDSVELVNGSDILANFWKNGKLVKTGDSNYNHNIPTEYQSVPREFLLKTDASSTVWAFALEKGVTPNREWLIYVQSPEGNLSDITLTVPDVSYISVNSSQNGNFYTINESALQQTILLNTTNTSTLNTNVTITDAMITLGNGTSYYFDSEYGKDSNSGLSKDEAWQNISKFQNLKLMPGDNVLFKRGSVWRGVRLINFYYPSGTKENPITYTTYGNSKKPLPVITSMVDKQLKFSQSSINKNIWYCNELKNNPRRFFKNHQELLNARNMNEISDLQPWFYNYDEHRLYLYTMNNPNSAIFTLSYTTTCYLQNQEYIRIANLDLQGGTSLRSVGSSNILVTNSKIGKNSSYGAIFTNSQINPIISNIICQNNIFDSGFRLDYSFISPGGKGADYIGSNDGLNFGSGVKNSIISNNFFIDWNHASISLETSSQEGIHDNQIFNNTLTAPDIDYGGRFVLSGNAYNNTIHNNLITNIAVRNQIGGHDNHFYNNVIDRVRNSHIKDVNIGQCFQMSPYNGNVYHNTVEHNVFKNCDGAGIYLNSLSTTDDGPLIYDNNFSYNIISNNDLDNINYKEETDIFVDKFPDIKAQIFNNNYISSSKIFYKGQYIDIDNFNTIESSIQRNTNDYNQSSNIGTNTALPIGQYFINF